MWHRHGMLLRCSLFLFGLFGMSANSAQAHTLHAAKPDWKAQSIHTLSHMPDADSQMMASILVFQAHTLKATPQAFQYLDNARTMVPAAPELAALAMLMCGQSLPSSRCRAKELGEHLRAIAPNNALGWLPALEHASDAHQSRRVGDILQQMANAKRFTTYSHALSQRIFAALKHLPAPDLNPPFHLDEVGTQHLEAAISTSLLPVAHFRPLIHACRHRQHGDIRRHAACEKIAAMLQASDRVFSVDIGLTLERINADTPQTFQTALTKSLRWQWLLQQRGKACSNMDNSRQLLCLNQYAAPKPAVDRLKAFVQQLGQPVTPPAGWGKKQVAHWKHRHQRH